MTAMIVGTALALLTLAYVLYPLYVGPGPAVRTDQKFCAKCENLIEDDAAFCSVCGSEIAAG